MFTPTVPVEYVFTTILVVILVLAALIAFVSFLIVLTNFCEPFFYWLDKKTKRKGY